MFTVTTNYEIDYSSFSFCMVETYKLKRLEAVLATYGIVPTTGKIQKKNGTYRLTDTKNHCDYVFHAHGGVKRRAGNYGHDVRNFSRDILLTDKIKGVFSDMMFYQNKKMLLELSESEKFWVNFFNENNVDISDYIKETRF